MIAQMIHLNSRAAEAFNAVQAAAHYQQVGRCGRTDKCDIKCQFFSIATGGIPTGIYYVAIEADGKIERRAVSIVN